MSKLWNVGLRWIALLGMAGILFIANGCGGGGGGSGSENSPDTVDSDTTPDAFSIAAQTDVPVNREVTSAPFTVTGINTATPITVRNGSYSIGSDPFVTTDGTVTNNQSVRVRHISHLLNNGTRTTTLNIGGVTATFVSSTVPADITPAPFTFTPLTGVWPGRSVTSNAVTISGLNRPAPILITGGTYSIDGGNFTSDPGTVSNGQTVMVRTFSSSVHNAVATAHLNIGDQTSPFSVTTMESGGRSTTPAAFAFTNMTNQPAGTTVTSAPITVSGVTAAETPISVSGGSYSIGTGPFTSAAGTVTNTQNVRVQHTSGFSSGATVTTILNIGGVIGSFTSTTRRILDGRPDPFSFTAQTNVPPGATVTSNEITVSGIEAPATITVIGGSYSIDNGPFATRYGEVNNGQRVVVRHTAAATNNTATLTRLNIGGVYADFNSSTGSTIGTDTSPDPFEFARQTNVPLNSVVTSPTITVTGIDAPVVIWIQGAGGCSYSIDGGPFTNDAGTISNGQSVTIRHTSSAGNGANQITGIYIGDREAIFVSTTVPAASVKAAAR